jgi:signal transduction histidine kinase
MQPILAEETQRLQALVEDLLTLSKADDEGVAVRREDVDLDDVRATELRRLKATSGHRITLTSFRPRWGGRRGDGE